MVFAFLRRRAAGSTRQRALDGRRDQLQRGVALNEAFPFGVTDAGAVRLSRERLDLWVALDSRLRADIRALDPAIVCLAAVPGLLERGLDEPRFARFYVDALTRTYDVLEEAGMSPAEYQAIGRAVNDAASQVEALRRRPGNREAIRLLEAAVSSATLRLRDGAVSPAEKMAVRQAREVLEGFLSSLVDAEMGDDVEMGDSGLVQANAELVEDRRDVLEDFFMDGFGGCFVAQDD